MQDRWKEGEGIGKIHVEKKLIMVMVIDEDDVISMFQDGSIHYELIRCDHSLFIGKRNFHELRHVKIII
jgi:hypothetical protein